MIKDKDITVLIQGPYYENITDKTIFSALKFFKTSKIIFSTYNFKNKNLNNSRLKFIINKLPKPTPHCLKPKQFYNYYGQVRTTLNGLKKCNSKYCLKIRSDCIINSKSFKKFFFKYKKKINNYNFLDKKVIISSHYTVDPRKSPLPFHFSDWFFFGLTKDVKKIFNQKYLSKENLKVPLWFYKRKKPNFFFSHYLSRYRAEQHIMVNFIKKFTKINFKHGYDYNLKNIILTEKILVSNFIVLDPDMLNLISLKHLNFSRFSNLIYFNDLIDFYKYQILYKKYCDIFFKINKRNKILYFKTFLWILCNPKVAIHKLKIFRRLL